MDLATHYIQKLKVILKMNKDQILKRINSEINYACDTVVTIEDGDELYQSWMQGYITAMKFAKVLIEKIEKEDEYEQILRSNRLLRKS